VRLRYFTIHLSPTRIFWLLIKPSLPPRLRVPVAEAADGRVGGLEAARDLPCQAEAVMAVAADPAEARLQPLPPMLVAPI